MNLTLGQAAWTQIFRELMALYGKPIKDLRDKSRKFDDSLARVQILDNNGSASVLSAWTFAGSVYGKNTDENGKLFPRVTKDSTTTTIAAGSNGVNVNTFVGAGILNCASTTGFPTSGTITVATGSGNQVVSYTGVTGTTFTGCSCSGAGVMSTGGAIAVCTVNVYTATGASGLVATGTGAYTATGTNTITLAASNSSGLTGTVAVGVLSASEAVDTHFLTIFNDYILNGRAILDGTQPEHGALFSGYRDALIGSQGDLKSAITKMQAAMVHHLVTRVARTLNSSQPSTINLATKSTSGIITTDFSGILEDLRAAMADETSPAAQTILKNVLTAAAAVFPSTNDGKATLSGPTLSEFAYAGTITGLCTDATFGAEKFALTQRVSGTQTVLAAANSLTIDCAFADPSLGISSMTLNRLLTLSVGSSNDFGSMSNWTLTGLSSSNVDSNLKLYPKVIVGVVDPAKWIMQLYSSSSLASTALVAQSAEAASSATGVLLTAQNGSGLAGVVAIGSGPTAGHNGTVSCNGWQTKNVAKNVADSFTVAITQASVGEIQDIVRVLLGYALNSASSNPTIPDGILSAGTFPPFVARDV